MAETLSLTGANGVSEIHIETGLLDRAGAVILETFSPSRVHIVSDSTVAPLYLEKLEKQFSLPVTHTVIPAGEEHKQLSTVEGIYHDLLTAGMTRKDLIIALGGGVVGDITGFAAATFLRGVSLCQIPTTLLAQVDSSVGGKTGVDLPEGKNLVGAFYQPRLVLIDPNVLASLPDSTFADGMAEVIKYGCIWDRAFFDFLVAHPSRAEIMAEIEHVLYTCCDIKRQVVMADERDTGLRMILNFGHTIGHAFELAGRYETWTHGQAVAAGMNWAARLGAAAGVTPAGTAQAITALTEKFGLPADIPCPWNIMAEAVGLDKKRSGDSITLIFLSQLGTTAPTKMKKDELLALLKPMFEK